MRLRGVALAIAILGAPRVGRGASEPAAPAADEADDPSRWLKELEVEAGSAEADLRLRELDLRDGVRVRLLPYHLRAERIHLSLGRYGVRVTGNGVLTFCPCEDPPVAIGFSGGWAGPPDELIVEDPTLRLFGLPVFWLPYLWLRSPRKIGLTTPDVSFRGPDGLFLGQGVHFPIGKGLETTVGFYTAGGFATTLDLATERTWTLVKLDVRRDVGERDVPSGAGLAIDARGDLAAREAAAANGAAIAWDVDAIRGARGVRTTLELDALARPFDRASGVARLGPARLGVEAVAPRLGPLDRVALARPFVALGSGVALSDLGGATAAASFGPRWVLGRGAETIGDASLGATIASPIGLATFSSHARVDGRVARGGGPDPDIPASGDRATAIVGEVGLELALPLARPLALDRAAGGPPVLHVVEPLVRATAVGARAAGQRSALAGFVGAPALGGDATTALLAVSGVRTSLGALGGGIAPGRDPWIGRLAGELVSGALLIDGRRDAAVAGELSWTTRRADGGSTKVGLQGATTRALDARAPWAWLGLARTRWESSRDGFGVELRGALRGDVPVLAGWALLGAEAAPRLTTATGLASPGATIGAGTAFPIGFGLRLGGDVDVFGDDVRTLFARDTRLLQARSTLRYRHPCGCFRLAVRGGHVIGRQGVDVFATFELAHVDPNDPREF